MPSNGYPTCIDCGKCGCDPKECQRHAGVYLCAPCQEKRKKAGK